MQHCISGYCSGNEIIVDSYYKTRKYSFLFHSSFNDFYMFLDCLVSQKYDLGAAHWVKIAADNAKECWEYCGTNHLYCHFWDMDDGNCRQLSTDGGGASVGYPGAMGGAKNCNLRGSGPQGYFGPRGNFSNGYFIGRPVGSCIYTISYQI